MGTVVSRAAKRTGTAVAGVALVAVALAPAMLQAAHAATSVTVTRIAGSASDDNRNATQAAISRTEFPGDHTAGAVIVTRGNIIPDGISASDLAGAKGTPILLLGPPGSAIPPETSAEITRVLVPNGFVYVLGDLKSVDLGERAALASLIGGGTVVNVDGTGTSGNRFVSSANHATVAFTAPSGGNPVKTYDGGNGALRTAFFANGFSLIDALCAGQLAFLGYPVFLIDNSKSTLDPSVLSAISAVGVEQGITLGDAKSLNASLTTAIKNATGHNVLNQSGNNRFSTCAALATLSLSAPWSFAPASGVILTLGFPRVGDPSPPNSLVDSIGAGVLGGKLRAPVILATPQFGAGSTGLPPESSGFLTTNATPIRTIYIPGSAVSTPDSAGAAARAVVAGGSTPADVSSIGAKLNSHTMTVTFSKPVWSSSQCTTPGTGLCADFQVTVAGSTTPANTVAIAATPATATTTVTLSVVTAPTAPLNTMVTIAYAGSGSFFVADQSSAGAATSSASTTATNPGQTGFTSISASGTTVTANFDGPVGLCTPASTTAGVLSDTLIAINGGAGANPTAGTSITNPPQSTATIVSTTGSNSYAVAFTTAAIPAGATVKLTFTSPQINTQLCDSNNLPFSGTTQSTTA